MPSQTFDAIVAKQIVRFLGNLHISSHERIVLDHYTCEQANAIVKALLVGQAAGQTRLDVQLDDLSTRSISLPSLSAHAVELVPYVVTPAAPCHDWEGSRGFATRLREVFHSGCPSGVTRILLIFDQHPVETERTTGSAELAASIDSLDSLIAWLQTADARAECATPAAVHEIASKVLAWWRDHISESPGWQPEAHHSRLERAVSFMQACAAGRSVGAALPELGLLFRDDDLASADAARLSENARRARELDNFRIQRTVDPVVAANRLLDLDPDDEFSKSMREVLCAPERLVTTASVTFSEVLGRLRAHQAIPAHVVLSSLEFVEASEEGKPQGAALPWHALRGPGDERDEISDIEVVVSSQTGRVFLTATVFGDQEGKLLHGDTEERLAPNERPTSNVIGVLGTAFKVHELLIRPEGQGRRKAPTQRVRIAVVQADRLFTPLDASLDVKRSCFVVDGGAEELVVQLGSSQRMVRGDDLPPTDGEVADLTVDGCSFRWRGQDRPPAEPRETALVRIFEQLAVSVCGVPTQFEPVETTKRTLAAESAGVQRDLDVPSTLLEAEEQLLRHPSEFAGDPEDSRAAFAALAPAVDGQLRAWLDARAAFFAGVIAQVTARSRSLRPTIYLADLRAGQPLGTLADTYIDAYLGLVSASIKLVRDQPNATVVESVVYCDRTLSGPGQLRLAPSHPMGVALLATLQRGLLTQSWANPTDRKHLSWILDHIQASGSLNWVSWRGEVLTSAPDSPLLWHVFGSPGGPEVDTDSDLEGVVYSKTKRLLLDLCPHLNRAGHTLFVNLEVAAGSADYLTGALSRLLADNKVKCRFDVGIKFSSTEPSLVRIFTGRPSPSDAVKREELAGRVAVRRLSSLSAREAHLVFRARAPGQDLNPLGPLPTSGELVRDTGYGGGLLSHPARYAHSEQHTVRYTRYLHTVTRDAPSAEGLWDGPSRSRWRRVGELVRRLSLGGLNSLAGEPVPSRQLRQVARSEDVIGYTKSFITVHCDPDQGPEYFVGQRGQRTGVYLVECSDRGEPELPGRDIVSVTPLLSPFQAALGVAMAQLPPDIGRRVGEPEASSLLRDINLLRGTKVFDFMRVAARHDNNPLQLMDGLDNVLAMRWFLGDSSNPLRDQLPVVVALKDLVERSPAFSALGQGGIKCDDLLVFYLPRVASAFPTITYRLVEVKFGPRQRWKKKAKDQLLATGKELAQLMPTGVLRDDPRPLALMLGTDVALALHEALERYRSFQLIQNDEEVERTYGLKHLFASLNAGEVSFAPWGLGTYGQCDAPAGTALMFDYEIPGRSALAPEPYEGVELLTLPLGVIEQLILAPATWIGLDQPPAAAPSAPPSPSRPFDGGAARRAPAPSGAAGEQGGPPPVSTDAQSPEGSRLSTERPASAAPATTSPAAVAAPKAPTSDSPSSASPQGAAATKPDDAGPPSRSRAPEEPELDRIELAFRGFVGNVGAVTRIKRSLRYQAQAGDRVLDPIALFGSRSLGKTELARRIGRALDVPVVELGKTDADDMAIKMHEKASAEGVAFTTEGEIEVAPPMVVFIDEVHRLTASSQTSLLTAVEPSDRLLRHQGGQMTTRQVTFVVATTDPGRLTQPFVSRFIALHLNDYSLDEVVGILQAKREFSEGVRPEAQTFDRRCLEIIATVGRLVPRQALLLMDEAAMAVGLRELTPDPGALQEYFRINHSADEKGLTDSDRKYLRELFPDRVAGVTALASALGHVQSNLEQITEPYLIRLGLIVRERTGRKLTAAGREYVAGITR